MSRVSGFISPFDNYWAEDGAGVIPRRYSSDADICYRIAQTFNAVFQIFVSREKLQGRDVSQYEETTKMFYGSLFLISATRTFSTIHDLTTLTRKMPQGGFKGEQLLELITRVIVAICGFLCTTIFISRTGAFSLGGYEHWMLTTAVCGFAFATTTFFLLSACTLVDHVNHPENFQSKNPTQRAYNWKLQCLWADLGRNATDMLAMPGDFFGFDGDPKFVIVEAALYIFSAINFLTVEWLFTSEAPGRGD